ncbi:RNA polymerase sigma factor [Aliiglaciecola sp. M165]|uniref:RNA polymerase sigma factor n=1 Tax=Aliiglaciecola sp. M165 TaxID=2593649 RepID=UPI00117C64A0|nr:RNA polymerase sigma factor [Aliiglaciecola sp. M165]TRY33324.1 RNA polymerase sigma factor [Aliiglaciecola sp. M165]
MQNKSSTQSSGTVTKKSPFHQVFMSAKDSMERMVSRIVPPKEIEDIVQETYVRICQLENHENVSQPKSFLMTTARNLAFDHVKRAESRLADGVESELDFDAQHTRRDPVFDGAASDEEFAHFCEAVRQLPLQCRRVFVLKKVYGYSQKEIANEMNLSQSTVEKHIATGFKRCATYMLRIDEVNKEQADVRSATVTSLKGQEGRK